jgi:AraC family transcriptional regulator
MIKYSNMEPRIEILNETRLIGKKMTMSFAINKTKELWQSFMPRRTEIKNSTGTELYSVELYPDKTFFNNFNPAKEFEKWAAIRVTNIEAIPDGMDGMVISEGKYAVFHYKGKASEAQGTYQYIFSKWIPNSIWDLDDRPHFAVMGEKYMGEHPDSEEELWIPIKKK